MEEAGRYPEESLEVYELKSLLENKDKLLNFRRDHGRMTLGDLCKPHLGKKMNTNASRFMQQYDFASGIREKSIADFTRRHPALKDKVAVIFNNHCPTESNRGFRCRIRPASEHDDGSRLWTQ